MVINHPPMIRFSLKVRQKSVKARPRYRRDCLDTESSNVYSSVFQSLNFSLFEILADSEIAHAVYGKQS